MRVTDITGTIENGMWHYGSPWPEPRVERIAQADWVPWKVNSWKFSFAGQSGTYLQTGLHFCDDQPPLIDVSVDRLYEMPAVVLKIPGKTTARDVITPDDLEACHAEIRPGDAILVSVGRDAKWNDPDFISGSPYYSREGMAWILKHRPRLLGGDWPKWDSLEDPQDVLVSLSRAGVLLLAPLVNLGAIRAPRVRLTVLPLKIAETCHTPARAVVIEE